jgi:anti-sigma factor RsiW
MSENTLTCELVDEGDLDTRYLTGRLSPEESERFEAHFFGCDRCWELVHQGLEIRSALGEPAVRDSRIGATVSGRAGTRPRWWGLAAAAGIAAIALGVWRLGYGPDSGRSEDVFRGDVPSLIVTTGAEGARLTAAWPTLGDADVYRVRLYSADGLMAFERETSDTVISVAVDSLPTKAMGGPMFWQVQALDRLRNPVARSDLARAVLPNP